MPKDSTDESVIELAGRLRAALVAAALVAAALVVRDAPVADRMRTSVAGSLAKTYEEVTSEAAGETMCLGQAGIAQTDALTPDCFVPECRCDEIERLRMLVQRTRADTTPRRRVVLRVRSR
jgi:hypothetical protein